MNGAGEESEEEKDGGTQSQSPSWPTMGEVYEGRRGAHTERWGLKGGCRECMQRNKKSRRR